VVTSFWEALVGTQVKYQDADEAEVARDLAFETEIAATRTFGSDGRTKEMKTGLVGKKSGRRVVVDLVPTTDTEYKIPKRKENPSLLCRRMFDRIALHLDAENAAASLANGIVALNKKVWIANGRVTARKPLPVAISSDSAASA